MSGHSLLLGKSVDPLYADRLECAVVFELDTELDGATAHLTVFYVLAFAGGQVDPGFVAFAAIRALHGHELLELTGAAGAGLEHRLQAVELVDIARLTAGDA